jgi:23S rRNA (guanosine2251-2'-O)-methyltransferase
MGRKREILYGRQPVCEALRAGRRDVFRVLVGDWVKPSKAVKAVLKQAERRGVDTVRVTAREMQSAVRCDSHQGIAAEAAEYHYVNFDDILTLLEARQRGAFALVLDCIQDPQNLGSLLRTADAAGVHAVVIPADGSAAVTPAAVRASSGAAEHATVSIVTNLARAMAALKECGLWMIGLEAVDGATGLWETDLERPVGLVVGSEGRGLRRLVRETCDSLVRIPQYGNVSSLNAGVAGAIAMYEVCRSRNRHSSGDDP